MISERTIAGLTGRRAAPLPQPPAKLLDGRGHLELMEDWLFNDNGKFQLRELAAPQAQAYDCSSAVQPANGQTVFPLLAGSPCCSL